MDNGHASETPVNGQRINSESGDDLGLIKAEVRIKEEPVDTVAYGDDGSLENSLSSGNSGPSEQLKRVIAAYHVGKEDRHIRHRYSFIKAMQPPDTLACEVCQSEFIGQSMLQTHKLCHFNTSHVCYVCDSFFVDTNMLMMHMSSIHPKLNPANHNLKEDREFHICGICLQKFSNKVMLNAHISQHLLKDEKNFACNVCGLDFIGALALRTHLRSMRHHDMKVRVQSIFVCVDCRSIFATRDSYAMHMMLRAQNESCRGLMDAVDAHQRFVAANPDITQAAMVANAQAMIAQQQKAQQLQQQQQQQQQRQQQQTTPVIATPVSDQEEINKILAIAAAEAIRNVNDSKGSHKVESSASVPPAEKTAPSPLPPMLPLNLTQEKTESNTNNTENCVCSKCLTILPNKDALAIHTMMHSRSESMPDPLAMAASPVSLASRPNSAPATNQGKANTWTCGHCFITLESCDALAMHMMTKHTNEPLNCLNSKGHQAVIGPNTKITFEQHNPMDQTKEDENRNRKRVNEETPDDVASHKKACMLPDDSNITKENEDNQKLFCHVCDLQMADEEAMDFHNKSKEHQKQTLLWQRVCRICGWVASSRDLLPGHLISEHRVDEKDVPEMIKNTSSMMSEFMEKNDADNMMNSSLPTSRRSRKTTPHPYPSQTPESTYGQEQWNNEDSRQSPSAGILSAVSQSGIAVSDAQEDGDIVDYVLARAGELAMCKHCKIIFTDRTLYCLHMGLHNLNDPWQCNMCGRSCNDLHGFSSHVLHC